jgi:hypothetical protein
MDEQQDKKAQQGPKKLGLRGKGGGMTPKQKSVPFVIDPETGMKIFIKTVEMGKDGIQTVDMKAKGGRAGFKSGSKGCKLAMKGKGRAYGKNS